MHSPKIDPVEGSNIAARACSPHREQLQEEMDQTLSRIGVEALMNAQHERTLAWVRERLAAGEHLDDLLGDPPV